MANQKTAKIISTQPELQGSINRQILCPTESATLCHTIPVGQSNFLVRNKTYTIQRLAMGSDILCKMVQNDGHLLHRSVRLRKIGSQM